MLVERDAIVRQHEGLHARPAARVAQLAKSFRADIEIRKGEQVANAKSTARLMLLAVKQGERIRIRADGNDAEEAVAELLALVSDPSQADQTDATSAARRQTPSSGVVGVPASEGVVVGPAFVYLPSRLEPPPRRIEPAGIPDEIARFRQAVADISAFLDQAGRAAEPTEAQIFTALRELAGDPELIEPVEALIMNGQDAASATLAAGCALADRFSRIDDAYFRTRADDVNGIARRLATVLLGLPDDDLAKLSAPSILIAADLSAMDIARLPVRFLAGLLTTEGGATSHIAIIARSLGIPAIVGARITEADLRRAQTIALDGSTGEAVLDPSDAVTASFDARRQAADARRRETERFTHLEPLTTDGTPIEVAANIGTEGEVDAALAHGAMGIGLFRTEFLFMRGSAPPSEDEQFRTYARVLKAFAPRPVLVRTLDIGGDKQVPGLALDPEANPFLGWRGIRMCLDRPDLFEPQLRALLRAATHGRLRVMFPMISDVSEVLAARASLERCRADLAKTNTPTGPIELGIMIETPAAALCAAELAGHVDFFSIGTNDLTQYTMAADRTNARLARLGRVDHPAVLRLIELACQAAHDAGIWVGVCGEAAGDPALIPRLLAWGVTELSMSAPLIPRAKQAILQRPGLCPGPAGALAPGP